jgi:hypothetical protein
MCRFYDPRAVDACTEDDAAGVQNKKTPNFCDYFKPNPDAFTGRELAQAERATHELAALFGDRRSTPATAEDEARAAAEALFGRAPKG